MRKNNSLLVVTEENLISRIIKNLKSFLRIKQTNDEEDTNRTAEVITAEKIKVNYQKDITQEELNRIDAKVLADITYIDSLNENELDSLDEFYDLKIQELEYSLTDKKSKYFKVMSRRA